MVSGAGYDDNLPRRPSERSGTVTAVGVLAIVLGGMALTCGLCGGACGFALPALLDLARKENNPQLTQALQELERIPAWFIILGGIMNTLRGGGLVLGGIGVLRRAHWGRYLTLAMAAFSILWEFASIGVSVATGQFVARGIVSVVFALLIAGGFAAFAFIALLNPKNVEEFNRRSAGAD